MGGRNRTEGNVPSDLLAFSVDFGPHDEKLRQ